MLNQTEDTRNSQDKTLQSDHTAPLAPDEGCAHASACERVEHSHNAPVVSTTMLPQSARGSNARDMDQLVCLSVCLDQLEPPKCKSNRDPPPKFNSTY